MRKKIKIIAAALILSGSNLAAAPFRTRTGVRTLPALPVLPRLIAPPPAPKAAPALPPTLGRDLAGVKKSLEALPRMSQASAGDAHEGGSRIEEAMTRSQSMSSAGDPVPAGSPGPGSLEAQVREAKETVDNIRRQVGRVIVGQREMVDAIVMAIILQQHVLLEGLPGVGKTETTKAFAQTVGGEFRRVQGTPDKLPPDILGSEILQENPKTGEKEFVLKRGPVFANILLMDEINRMPPKAQAALLEAMAEKHVTIGANTLALPQTFTVLATQNPIEQDGTYRLPEAQLDRFMFKVIVPQPSEEELRGIMERNESAESKPLALQVTTLEKLDGLRRIASKIRLDESLKDYIAKLARAAAHHPDLKGQVKYSVYVRAAIFMVQAARAQALLEGRSYVLPADIQAVAPLVLRHRIVLSYEAEQAGHTPDKLIEKILKTVPIPKPAP